MRKFDAAFHHRFGRLGDTAFSRTRLVLWSTSQRPIEELCGNDEAARARLGSRLLTIPVPTDRMGKVVADLPDDGDIASSAQLIDALNRHIRNHYGHAALRLIQKLLVAAAGDEPSLRADVKKYVADFLALVSIDESDGPVRLAATRFGLVSAAGHLARRFGALPDELDTDAAVLACYRMHTGIDPYAAFLDRLRDLLKDPKTFDLGSKGKLPKVSKQQRSDALAYVRRHQGETRLYIRPKHIHLVFPEWESLKSRPSVTELLVRETEKRKSGSTHQHRQIKCLLGRGRKPERVFCFSLSSTSGKSQ